MTTERPARSWPEPTRAFVADAVHSYHEGRRRVWPRGVLVGAGRVLGFFDPADRSARRGLSGVTVHDLSGCTISPGFFDAHNHQPTAAKDIGEVETAHVRSVAELVDEVARAAGHHPAGTWISTEHSLTISQLGTDRPLTRHELDGATTDHPVAVRLGAHTMLLNSLALSVSGIADLDGDPVDGIVERDRSSDPLGVIREYGATRLVQQHLPQRGRAELVPAMRSVQRRYADQGVTAVRVTGLRPGDIAVYEQLLREDGRMATRVFGGPRVDPTMETPGQVAAIRAWPVAHGFGSPWLTLDAVKIFVDGGIESVAQGHQHFFVDRGGLDELVSTAVQAGWSVASHAVSVEAIDMVLDAYARATPLLAAGCTLVIEHGFFCTPDQLRRAASLGVWLSTQPGVVMMEADSLRSGVDLRRLDSICPLATAMDLGVRCALGSDWNATPGTRKRPFSPLSTVRAAVHRAMRREDAPMAPSERVAFETAMFLHTRAPAQLVGADDLGGIWPGARADFVALSGDPEGGQPEAEVLATVVAGEPVEAP